jgi:hypothetical protein
MDQFKAPTDVIKDVFEKLNSNQETLSVESNALDKAMKQAQLQKFRDDNNARKGLGQSIFIVTVVWMILVYILLIENGRGHLVFSDTVLVTIITTTTMNVFGFLYVVVNYLFNKDKST